MIFRRFSSAGSIAHTTCGAASPLRQDFPSITRSNHAASRSGSSFLRLATAAIFGSLPARNGRIRGPITAMLAVGGMMLIVTGCERKHEYSQQTPNEVLQTALKMVQQDDTARLSELLYAESPQMRAFWNETGVLLGNMQKLSKAVQVRFPEEFNKLKAEAQDRAARGEAASLFDIIRQGGPGGTGGNGGGRRGGRGSGVQIQIGGNGPSGTGSESSSSSASTPGAAQAGERDQIRDLINRLFADPYDWLETNAPRLSAEQISDDTATILLDGQPVIPIVGLPMRLEDDRWFIVLPLSVPPVGEVMPRTDEQWQILRSVVRVLNRTVLDMTGDVQAGRVVSLDALARNAQQKALFPAAIAFAAYGKELDISNRVQRRTRTFRTKLTEWSRSRAKLDGVERADDAVARTLRSTLERLAPVEIEQLIRQNKPSRFDEMSEPEFEELLAAWLRKAGLKIDLDQSLAPERVDPIIQAWEKARQKSDQASRAAK